MISVGVYLASSAALDVHFASGLQGLQGMNSELNAFKYRFAAGIRCYIRAQPVI
ncbi:MAG: hypothetical protein QNJ03_15120 [Dinoroseobacter sp.]|nr:hypothetical protein [Dinoroseobacter sp.]